MKDPDFDILFSIGGFHVYWYAVLLVVGILAAMMISDRRAKGRAVPQDIALDLCILGVPFGVVGGRLFACLSGTVAWNGFFDLTRAGLSFFGSVLFAGAAILVYLKLRKFPVGEILDLIAPGGFAAIGIAVWGDFFDRVHYGPLVEKAAHKWFPLATYGNDLRIHYAAFFYEFLLCVVLIVLYYALLRRKVSRKADRFLLMTLGYCLGRFAIDSIRQDLVMVGPMAFDQLCEILLSILCLLLLFVKKRPQEAETDQAPQTQTADDAPCEPSEPVKTQKEGEEKENEGNESSKSMCEKPFSGLN